MAKYKKIIPLTSDGAGRKVTTQKAHENQNFSTRVVNSRTVANHTMSHTKQRFFDDGPDAICISDQQFAVKHVNHAFERLLGYNFEQLRGKPLWDLVETQHRETAERVLRAVPAEGVKRVWPFVTQGGQSITLSLHLIKSPGGSFLTTFREVIENRELDQKRLSVERSLTFLEYAPIPMYEINGAGIITLWNSEMTNLFGISASEAIGRSLVEVVKSDSTPDEMRRVQHDLTSMNKAVWFGTHERRNGPPIQCSWTCVRMQDDQGKTLGIAVTGVNLTESLAKEHELQQSLDLIKAQRDELRALSTPILEIWDNVLALPVIGTLDETRAANLMQDLLTAISTRDCRFAILDLTGVAHIDESSATHLVSILKAIGLLGARGIVTGLRPIIARTMVESGIDFTTVATLPTLRAGLKYCFDELRGPNRVLRKQASRSTSRTS